VEEVNGTTTQLQHQVEEVFNKVEEVRGISVKVQGQMNALREIKSRHPRNVKVLIDLSAIQPKPAPATPDREPVPYEIGKHGTLEEFEMAGLRVTGW